MFVLPGRESGEGFELRTEVGGAGVVQAVGYLAKGKFAVVQQFLGPLYLLGDTVFLDGGALRFGEQLAQRAVVVAAPGGQVL